MTRTIYRVKVTYKYFNNCRDYGEKTVLLGGFNTESEAWEYANSEEQKNVPINSAFYRNVEIVKRELVKTVLTW